MSKLGNLFYYRMKYKLFLLPKWFAKQKKQIILGLSYQHNWEVPSGWHVDYFDINSKLTFTVTPDMVVEREFNDGKAEYSFLYNHTLKRISPKIFWFIDAHVSDANRVRYCDHFDFVFVAQSSYVNYVKSITSCKNVFWLPLCFPNPNSEISDNVQPVKYPVSFIGTVGTGYEKRNEMISFLQKEYGDNLFVTTNFNDQKSLIQQSKITTNQSLKNDLNFRVFEVIGYGTELVTNYVEDIDMIEGLAERINSFHDHETLKNTIDKLLEDEPGYSHDMPNVQRWIRERHTMKNRMSEMLEMIDSCKQIEYK